MCADGVGVGGEKGRWAGASMDARMCADGAGAGERLEMGGERGQWAGASMDARTCADGVGAWERLEMGGERGRWGGASVDARTCAEKVGNVCGEEPEGMSERGCADVSVWVQGKRLEMGRERTSGH